MPRSFSKLLFNGNLDHFFLHLALNCFRFTILKSTLSILICKLLYKLRLTQRIHLPDPWERVRRHSSATSQHFVLDYSMLPTWEVKDHPHWHHSSELLQWWGNSCSEVNFVSLQWVAPMIHSTSEWGQKTIKDLPTEVQCLDQLLWKEAPQRQVDDFVQLPTKGLFGHTRYPSILR